MLIAVAIVVGIVLLTRTAEKAVAGTNSAPPSGQYSNTALAATATHNFPMPDGSPTFTPSNQRSNVRRALPIELVGLSMADPSRIGIRETFDSSENSPHTVQMLGIQRIYNGDF